MAKSVGIIGGISGKLGNVVFGGTAKNGEAIIRKYNPTPRNPKSARQTRTRAIFVLSEQIVRSLLPAIRLGWQQVAPSREFQKAMSIAAKNVGGAVTIDPVSGNTTENFQDFYKFLSSPDLSSQNTSALDLDTAGLVKFDMTIDEEITKDSGGNPIGVGIVTAVYQPDTKKVFVVLQNGEAGTNNVTVEVPTYLSGLRVHVYCFVKQTPNSNNGIPTGTQPWRYPGKTTETVYVGSGDVN